MYFDDLDDYEAERRFEVVYYHPLDGRILYWPADNRAGVLSAKLRECRAAGNANARLCAAGA
jgi:hypothetical protein